MKIFLPFLILLFSLQILASSKVGIIVKRKGDVELLTNESSKFFNKKGVLLFEGKYYESKKVRPGMKLRNGDILKTGNKSKARIVYKNGDQLNIGEGTAFRISWSQKTIKEKAPSTINLINGALRGVISKKGPRSGLKVKSRSAVMGVRGTDFHFSQRGTSGQTAISVLRGKVEVAKPETPKEKLNVSQGFSAELNTKVEKKTKKLSKLKLIKTSQQDLVQIQKDSKIIETKKEKLAPELEEELSLLEKKAISNTLEDIKEYQPEIYKVLEKKDITEVDTVNTVVVAKAMEKAPQRRAKKSLDEMGIDLNEDAYKKYFKVNDSIE